MLFIFQPAGWNWHKLYLNFILLWVINFSFTDCFKKCCIFVISWVRSLASLYAYVWKYSAVTVYFLLNFRNDGFVQENIRQIFIALNLSWIHGNEIQIWYQFVCQFVPWILQTPLHWYGFWFSLFFKRTRTESLDSYELTWTMKNICQYRSSTNMLTRKWVNSKWIICILCVSLL
jgi:hypothetical protein